MHAWKSCLVALVVLGGGASSALAQQGNAPNRGYATYPGAGTNSDYYSITNSFGPYGLPGTYPRYQGYGFSGYGPGAILNEYFVPWPGPRMPEATSPITSKSKPAEPKKAATKQVRSPRTSPTSKRPRK